MNGSRLVFVDDIVRGVCDTLHVSPEDLASSSRHKSLVLARFLIAGLTRHLAPRYSTPEIARAMGKQTHSSVVENIRKSNDPEETARVLDACVAEIRGDRIIYQTAAGRPVAKRSADDVTT